MWNSLIKQKIIQLIEEHNIEGEALSKALGREKSWYAQFKTNRRKRLDLDLDIIPILNYLDIDDRKFLTEIILDK